MNSVAIFAAVEIPWIRAIAIGSVVVILPFIILGIFASRYTKVGPNEVLVISGRKRKVTDPDGNVRQVGFRVVKGGGVLVWPQERKRGRLFCASRWNRRAAGRPFCAGIRQNRQPADQRRASGRVQQTRLDLAKSAKSGFEAGTNVSTLSGALAFLPRGITYLLFSPFPWGGGGIRVLLAMPETICWYLAFPLFIIGIVYSVRRHFRDATVVFFFVAQLTSFYGIFIGNVGTVHRQRTQVYVFYLIFTCVGWIYLSRKKKAPGGR